MISKRLRYEVLRRDNHTCRYCGGVAPDVKLTIDHVTPVALGGTDDPRNLVTACADCNAGKSSVSPDATVVADVAQDALRWSSAIKRAAELEAQARAMEYERYNEFDKAWTEWLPAFNGRSRWRPDDYENTLNQFLSAGLSMAEIRDAVYITSRKLGLSERDYWRYFCGVCWGKINRLNEIARSLLATEGD